jgi:hypothetical protein
VSLASAAGRPPPYWVRYTALLAAIPKPFVLKFVLRPVPIQSSYEGMEPLGCRTHQ